METKAWSGGLKEAGSFYRTLEIQKLKLPSINTSEIQSTGGAKNRIG